VHKFFLSRGKILIARISILGLSKFLRESSFKCEVQVCPRIISDCAIIKRKTISVTFRAGRGNKPSHEPKHRRSANNILLLCNAG
jgi:hypothetical protein